MRNMVKEVNGLTQDQIENIRQGLGEYATSRRFVGRRAKEPINPITGYGAKANSPATWRSLNLAPAAVKEKYKDTALTTHAIRQLALQGKISSVIIGSSRRLIKLKA